MVLINGKRVSDQMDEIVNDLGLCPQEDILFPDLNVFEQIEFFGLVSDLLLFCNIGWLHLIYFNQEFLKFLVENVIKTLLSLI